MIQKIQLLGSIIINPPLISFPLLRRRRRRNLLTTRNILLDRVITLHMTASNPSIMRQMSHIIVPLLHGVFSVFVGLLLSSISFLPGDIVFLEGFPITYTIALSCASEERKGKRWSYPCCSICNIVGMRIIVLGNLFLSSKAKSRLLEMIRRSRNWNHSPVHRYLQVSRV
ncbi:hypothetical protein BKA65DRAFT_290312 [Rhexocercosporidium sp. MPI-PUGE-AT-0058]|nr:hypothetical protein BKA65DRAFT_290312 [Rhexocercosporidium sp. MPI-PUGE-AT-0058]